MPAVYRLIASEPDDNRAISLTVPKVSATLASVLDPANRVKEIDERNNSAYLSVPAQPRRYNHRPEFRRGQP